MTTNQTLLSKIKTKQEAFVSYGKVLTRKDDIIEIAGLQDVMAGKLNRYSFYNVLLLAFVDSPALEKSNAPATFAFSHEFGKILGEAIGTSFKSGLETIKWCLGIIVLVTAGYLYVKFLRYLQVSKAKLLNGPIYLLMTPEELTEQARKNEADAKKNSNDKDDNDKKAAELAEAARRAEEMAKRNSKQLEEIAEATRRNEEMIKRHNEQLAQQSEQLAKMQAEAEQAQRLARQERLATVEKSVLATSVVAVGTAVLTGQIGRLASKWVDSRINQAINDPQTTEIATQAATKAAHEVFNANKPEVLGAVEKGVHTGTRAAAHDALDSYNKGSGEGGGCNIL